MAADRIRLTDAPPPRCSSCFQAQPHLRHVDFEASYDGPVVPLHANENLVGVQGVSIDDLILCETCVRTAAELLGLVDPDFVTAERDMLKTGNEVLVAKLQARDAYITTLEAAVANKQDVLIVPEKPDLDAAGEAIARAAEPPVPGEDAIEQLARQSPVAAIPATRRRRPRPRKGQS